MEINITLYVQYRCTIETENVGLGLCLRGRKQKSKSESEYVKEMKSNTDLKFKTYLYL